MTETILSKEAADRLAIRELTDTYCADRRDAGEQMALFTPRASAP